MCWGTLVESNRNGLINLKKKDHVFVECQELTELAVQESGKFRSSVKQEPLEENQSNRRLVRVLQARHHPGSSCSRCKVQREST